MVVNFDMPGKNSASLEQLAYCMHFNAVASGHLEKRQLTVIMYLLPLGVSGRGPIRSIPTVSHTSAFTGSSAVVLSNFLTCKHNNYFTHELCRYHVPVCSLALFTCTAKILNILDNSLPVKSFCNLSKSLVPSKMPSS